MGAITTPVEKVRACGAAPLSVLRAQATRCRRLAASITDQQAIDALLGLARDYEDKARGFIA